jgi:hypothetical protein
LRLDELAAFIIVLMHFIVAADVGCVGNGISFKSVMRGPINDGFLARYVFGQCMSWTVETAVGPDHLSGFPRPRQKIHMDVLRRITIESTSTV